MDSTHADQSTHTLESLLGVLHSKIAANAHADAVCTPADHADHAALLQKLDSIERACASLDILHQKVDSLCAGMQLIRSELEGEGVPQPAGPRADDDTITATADFVTINVRPDEAEQAVASCATTTVAVDAAVVAISAPSVPVPAPQEAAPDYTNSTDILNVLWPGLPKNEQDVLHGNPIRQEAELVPEVD